MINTHRLMELTPGDRAVIVGFDVDDQDLSRLWELGMSDGTQLRLVRYAPFGDPVEIKLRGFHLSLGKDVAHKVLVRKI